MNINENFSSLVSDIDDANGDFFNHQLTHEILNPVRDWFYSANGEIKYASPQGIIKKIYQESKLQIPYILKQYDITEYMVFVDKFDSFGPSKTNSECILKRLEHETLFKPDILFMEIIIYLENFNLDIIWTVDPEYSDWGSWGFKNKFTAQRQDK